MPNFRLRNSGEEGGAGDGSQEGLVETCEEPGSPEEDCKEAEEPDSFVREDDTEDAVERRDDDVENEEYPAFDVGRRTEADDAFCPLRKA